MLKNILESVEKKEVVTEEDSVDINKLWPIMRNGGLSQNQASFVQPIIVDLIKLVAEKNITKQKAEKLSIAINKVFGEKEEV